MLASHTERKKGMTPPDYCRRTLAVLSSQNVTQPYNNSQVYPEVLLLITDPPNSMEYQKRLSYCNKITLP